MIPPMMDTPHTPLAGEEAGRAKEAWGGREVKWVEVRMVSSHAVR